MGGGVVNCARLAGSALLVWSTHCTRGSLGKVSLGDDPDDSECDSLWCGVAVGEIEGVMSGVEEGVAICDGVVTGSQLPLKLLMPGTDPGLEEVSAGTLFTVEECCVLDVDANFRLLASPLRCFDDEDDDDFFDDR